MKKLITALMIVLMTYTVQAQSLYVKFTMNNNQPEIIQLHETAEMLIVIPKEIKGNIEINIHDTLSLLGVECESQKIEIHGNDIFITRETEVNNDYIITLTTKPKYIEYEENVKNTVTVGNYVQSKTITIINTENFLSK